MKLRLFFSLAATLAMCGQAFAQKVLLLYGQDTNEAWDAKYLLQIGLNRRLTILNGVILKVQ